jgi:hypothetical protein
MAGLRASLEIAVTNTSGMMSAPVAEMVLLFMLGIARNLYIEPKGIAFLLFEGKDLSGMIDLSLISRILSGRMTVKYF